MKTQKWKEERKERSCDGRYVGLTEVSGRDEREEDKSRKAGEKRWQGTGSGTYNPIFQDHQDSEEHQG